MDKNTLSNYGWIVIAVLVLSVMIALATPFGQFIANGFETTFYGFGQTNNSMIDTMYDSTGTPPSLEYLQSKYKFEYYSSFNVAVTDVNNDTIGANADVDKANATAGIYTDTNGIPVVVLLKDTSETKSIYISADMSINLGGNTLTFSNVYFGIRGKKGNTIEIDGRLNGSTIILYGIDGGGIAISSNESKLTVNGGSYFLYESNNSEDLQGYVFGSSLGGSFKATNCSATAIGTNDAKMGVITVKGEATIINCNFTVTTEDGKISACTIHDTGSIHIDSSKITAYSQYGSVIGILSNNSVKVNNTIISASSNFNNSLGIKKQAGEVNITNCTITADEEYIAT